jgi:hypothetical protein
MAAKAKRGRGQPTRYRSEYAGQAAKLGMLGYTDEKLAEFFGVGIATVYRWKKRHPEFKASCQDGKDEIDANVMSALYHRAVGYSHPDVHVSNYMGYITVTDLVKHHPPDTGAALFWLTNRQPHLFKKDPSGQDGENETPDALTINFGVNEAVDEVRVTRGKPKA